jgi:hypothetical protein
VAQAGRVVGGPDHTHVASRICDGIALKEYFHENSPDDIVSVV